MVLCSHEHGDHNARTLVKIREGQTCPFSIETIETWHDEVKGAKRGPNTIHIIDDGNIRLAHMGDMHLRKIDLADEIFVINVGG